MKKKIPLVSVIVAAHNEEKFIGRCLRSLLNQTLPHDLYEIIVINDGSKDRTPYALEIFYDAVHVITNKFNLGLPASVNKGILASRGRYIVRVDADDYVNSNFLNFLLFYLENNPDVDAVACDYWIFNDEEEWIERVSALQYPIACGILIRKRCLVKIGMYDESFRYHEDKDLRLRFEKKYQISHLALPLYRYRRHDKNITNNEIEMKRYRKKLFRKHGLVVEKNK